MGWYFETKRLVIQKSTLELSILPPDSSEEDRTDRNKQPPTIGHYPEMLFRVFKVCAEHEIQLPQTGLEALEPPLCGYGNNLPANCVM